MPQDKTPAVTQDQPDQPAADVSTAPMRAVHVFSSRGKGAYCASTAWVWQRARLVCAEAAATKEPE
jgi:hypothetical protein